MVGPHTSFIGAGGEQWFADLCVFNETNVQLGEILLLLIWDAAFYVFLNPLESIFIKPTPLTQ